MSEWISVKKELPQKSGKYLIYPDFGYVASFFSSEKGFFAIQKLYGVEITHWAPMLEPPK